MIQGMRVDFQMSPTHVEIGSSLAAMVVEDELVGHLRQESRYLFLSTPDQPSAFRPPNILPVSPSSNAAGSALSGAHPSVPAHTAAAMPSPDPPHKSDSEDEFYDAEETMSVSSMSVADLSSTASTAPRSSIDLRPMHTLDLGDAAPDAQETSQLALVRFTYIFPFSPLYNGVDAEVQSSACQLT